MKKIFVLLLLVLFSSSYCATKLTEGGTKVKLILKQEAPSECKLLGDIDTGLLGGEPSIIGVKNDLRNRTAEMGGNLVVIDTIEMHKQDGTTYYTGNGRAYKCP